MLHISNQRAGESQDPPKILKEGKERKKENGRGGKGGKKSQPQRAEHPTGEAREQ